MAINVDTVYQKVLAIANKEQRGYITPQEFNLFANQAQHDIFEQYFYDLNQFGRVPGNDTEYADMLDMLNEKISPFNFTSDELVRIGTTNKFILPENLYRLGTVILGNPSTITDIGTTEIERVLPNEILYLLKSKLTEPTKQRPVYVMKQNPGGSNDHIISVYPVTITGTGTNTIKCTYIRKPNNVKWGYIVINEKALYNNNTSVDFDLLPSEESDLVIKILTLAGVSIKDNNLYQIAAQEEIKEIQQEKQ